MWLALFVVGMYQAIETLLMQYVSLPLLHPLGYYLFMYLHF